MDDLREKITGLEDLAGQLHVGSFAWVTVRRELVAVRTELVELRRQDTVLLKGGGPGQQVGEATTCADNRCPAVAGADSEAGAVQLIRSQRRGKGGDCSGSGPYDESAYWRMLEAPCAHAFHGTHVLVCTLMMIAFHHACMYAGAVVFCPFVALCLRYGLKGVSSCVHDLPASL